jgi:NAD(P)-dependent dehydrogenase (short-subunit alcohol dehydrogenase family)
MNQPSKLRDKPGIGQFSLEGNIALITGATGHLGSQIAETLASAGAHVLLNSRRSESADAMAEAFHRKGLQATPIPFDITDPDAASAAVEDLRKRYTRLDVVVNNANAGNPATIEQAQFDDFQNAFSVAVASPFSLLKQLLPMLEASARHREGGASVINIASMYGSVSPDPSIYGSSGQNSAAYYGAAKGALIQLGRYLAVHLAPKGIRVNTISPGPFPNATTIANSPDFVSRLAGKTPMGRVGRAEEIGGPVLFLAAPASAYVTGANLAVDGGWTAW